jgi:hypothetical protein
MDRQVLNLVACGALANPAEMMAATRILPGLVTRRSSHHEGHDVILVCDGRVATSCVLFPR